MYTFHYVINRPVLSRISQIYKILRCYRAQGRHSRIYRGGATYLFCVHLVKFLLSCKVVLKTMISRADEGGRWRSEIGSGGWVKTRVAPPNCANVCVRRSSRFSRVPCTFCEFFQYCNSKVQPSLGLLFLVFENMKFDDG